MYSTSFRAGRDPPASKMDSTQMTRVIGTKANRWDPKELDQEEVKLIVHSL
jgi:hypothetical protein